MARTYPADFGEGADFVAPFVEFKRQEWGDENEIPKKKKARAKGKNKPITILKRTEEQPQHDLQVPQQPESTQSKLEAPITQAEMNAFENMIHKGHGGKGKEQVQFVQKGRQNSPGPKKGGGAKGAKGKGGKGKGISEEERLKQNIRIRIKRYFDAFNQSTLFGHDEPRLCSKDSMEAHMEALAEVEQSLNSAGAVDGLAMMVKGGFTILESFSIQFPQMGLNLRGLGTVLNDHQSALEPTWNELVIKHAEWFTMSVERRFVLELMQLVMATHKLNTDPAFAQRLQSVVAEKTLEQFDEL